jgi:hypothetical protein
MNQVYNTVDDMTSTKKKLQQEFGINGKTFDNQFEWNETYADDTFEEENADIDDS